MLQQACVWGDHGQNAVKRGRLILGAASGLEPVRRWPGARLGAPQERLAQCRIWQEASLGEPLQAGEEAAAEAEQRLRRLLVGSAERGWVAVAAGHRLPGRPRTI